MKYLLHLTIAVGLLLMAAEPVNSQPKFTRQDTLRGSVTAERAWWDVVHYGITVTPDYNTKTIKGYNRIVFKVLEPGINKVMQIDLQHPMKIENVYIDQSPVDSFTRDGNAWFIHFGKRRFVKTLEGNKDNRYQIDIVFSGKPREAKRPPWDGGWIWKQDAQDRPWMSVACQGLGASVWYPCKDYQGDEPDDGASLTMTVPDTLVAVGNGRMKQTKKNGDGTATTTWEVKNPINSYNIIPYIGKYANWTETYAGEKGNLDLSFWVLDYNLDKAKAQFGRDVKPMLKSFENWFGPYPFYEDGFKLVESPHLGMEHQSAVAYGNEYKNGYLGRDLSNSGWGLKWDFIIIHEAGHEWFGNNITTKEIADMWVHEGFTNYSETLFTESQFGKQAGNEYAQGIMKNVSNDRPVIGFYGVNKGGSGDMYAKGSSLLHTIRQVVNDDEKFRNILRGLNNEFYHKTVTSRQVEEFISSKAGIDFTKVFDQYLRTIMIPTLEYKMNGRKVSFRWTNVVDQFDMPLKLTGGNFWIKPKSDWQEIDMPLNYSMDIDPNFYITVKRIE